MGIKGSFRGNGLTRYEKGDLRVYIAKLANGWLVMAYGKHYHQEQFTNKSVAFQWAEGFLLYA